MFKHRALQRVATAKEELRRAAAMTHLYQYRRPQRVMKPEVTAKYCEV